MPGFSGSGRRPAGRWQADALRDIARALFSPHAVRPEHCTAAVVGLAEAIHEAGDFDNIPVLADAIEKAGCDRPLVLDHCRNPNGVHVRGCWVIDLILDRK